jgi:hypothetical protein
LAFLASGLGCDLDVHPLLVPPQTPQDICSAFPQTGRGSSRRRHHNKVGKSGDRLGKKIEEAKQEVKEEIAQDVDPLRDELDAVKEQNLPDPGTMPPPTGAAPPAPSMSPLTPLDRMKQALPRYRWRSVERLSQIAGVPEDSKF